MNNIKFSEHSRVKIPCILHLTRLGYRYLSLKNATWETENNIFTDIFKHSIAAINPHATQHDVSRLLENVKLMLDNQDLGKAFYKRLIDESADLKLIDFAQFDNNQFHVVTELTYKKGDVEFRPDITVLINGMPLVFIELKSPNNKEGIATEQGRMQVRCENPKFRHFINITQWMLFSNNMQYDDSSRSINQGAFYATTSRHRPVFNYFREEHDLSSELQALSDETENHILQDNNLLEIKHSPEFATNKSPDTATHQLCSSLLSRARFGFLLRYGLAYVGDAMDSEKHIMRYPQLFATLAIEQTLKQGKRNGIIWHTQGSGKTALTYYSVAYLTDYFRKQRIVPKFYFIVDRIDLLKQATIEFKSRGLTVHTCESQEAFAIEIRSAEASHNLLGQQEITVVNIQKFKDDPNVIRNNDYDVNMQRIYFLDEVHRSYKPEGSFLANLIQSDPHAIKIGLTGTPLLGNEYNSKSLFGGYIHQYYYDASIKDGYTLRLIREEITTQYKMYLQQALQDADVLENSIERQKVYAHHRFVEPMLDYIVEDFEHSRIRFDDNSIGGMVICSSSEQAKQMYAIFSEKYAVKKTNQIAEASASYNVIKRIDSKVKTAALILHDEKEREADIKAFKQGEIDFIFVYNMLLTGFDAPRLKKLYLGRVIKEHNLLQALTRVNRTYHQFRYGYVVDFADISQEFDATNQAYLKELQAELGDEMIHYSNLFLSSDEAAEEIEQIKQVLVQFDTENLEIFSQQIGQIQDPAQMYKVQKALGSAKSLYNLIRLQGHDDLLNRLDFQKLKPMYYEACNRLSALNLREDAAAGSADLVNVAVEDVLFSFVKTGESELVLTDKLHGAMRSTREAFVQNVDPKDPEYVKLKAALERLFQQQNLAEMSQADAQRYITHLQQLQIQIDDLNRRDNLLKAKYDDDPKYVRVHKRLLEQVEEQESHIFAALQGVKALADEQIVKNANILDNESYFERFMTRVIVTEFKQHTDLKHNIYFDINRLLVQEYMKAFQQD
ncbi:type I restriction endonuclease [Candidatus Albibeggiatoa sp. nov. BB20]|uniref:type I restriction endonuclease subunit R n=1 Tax=Candidatus Albibeggiatoa sp. nov. BB20 TaxID=3162723 RepID=UPI0033653E35